MDWKRFFDSVGFDGTKWQWRIMRWRKDREERRLRSGAKRPSISARHKFCEACGALLERDDRECVRCGARAPSYQGQAFRRRLASVLPAHSPATYLLAGSLVVIGLSQLYPPLYRALMNAGGWHTHSVLAEGQWWRAITYAWLHGGWMHLIFNTIALTQVGAILEREVGSARFFAVFFLTALSAALLFHLLGGVAMVGASGSLFGLIGLGLAYAHFYGGPAGRELRNFFIQWAVYGMLFGIIATFSGGMRIANSAHAGGLALGLLLGWLIERDLRQPGRWTRAWRVLASAFLLLSLVALAFAARLALRLL